MVKVGEEFVRTEVQFIPASLKVVDHYRETYECRACRKNGTPYMEKSPVPHPPVMHSLASASTIAWLVHQKFELGIPLYRQEKEWEAMGLSLSRATMSNWLLAVCRDWLSHVVSHLRRGTSKAGISAYRRDPRAGAEGTREEEHFGFLYVGVLQHQGQQTAGPVF